MREEVQRRREGAHVSGAGVVCEPRVQSHAAVQYTVGKRGMLFAEARPKEEG